MSGRKYGSNGYRGRAKKVDANEKEIIDALELIPGLTVVPIGKPVDLLCGYQGRTILLEVKNPEGKNRTTKAQDEFLAEWTGGTVAIVRSPTEALAAVGFQAGGLRGVTLAR